MKEENKIKTKSSFIFKIVMMAVILISCAFVWGAGYLLADKKVQKNSEKTSVVVVMEPKNNAPVVVEDEVATVETNDNEKMFEEIVAKISEEHGLVEKDGELIVTKEQPVAKNVYVSVVIDDMGISPNHTKEILSIKAPLSSSFLTYGQNLEEYTKEAVEAGHEILVHVPMEPKVAADLAPDTLMVSMTDDEIRAAFSEMLAKFDGIDIKGVNNHMGSLFTESAPKLDVIMEILKQKGLYFLDSKTTEYSRALDVASLDGVPYISRDVFLDNDNDYEKIMVQFEEVERIAEKTGFAVAICHPKSQTYLALKDWVETLKDKNIKLIHVSEMIDLKK